jgi:hypothetical protein
MTDPFDRLIDEGMANGDRDPQDVLLEMIEKNGRRGVTRKEFNKHPFTKFKRSTRQAILNDLVNQKKVVGFERNPYTTTKRGGRPRGACFIAESYVI